MRGAGSSGLLVAVCYQAFSLGDGALRMLVLLHLHAQGRSPLALALLLLPYEAAGAFANLLGGWAGMRFGRRPVLVMGLSLQAVACAMLAVEPASLLMPWVVLSQLLSGVAKDLVKTTSKSYVRTLAPSSASGSLFGAVAGLTGAKNAMKGLGFFVGGGLLAALGFRGTNLGIAAVMAALSLWALCALPNEPGKPRRSVRSALAQTAAVRWLALARLFLFGSRDAWFAVALPLFLSSTLGWSSAGTGAFLSAWVIGYAAVQAMAPRLCRASSLPQGAGLVVRCTALLCAPLLLMASVLAASWPAAPVLIIGLCVYGAVFAVCSSLHSWLVVEMQDGEDVVSRVGFYYAANSLGRLVGLAASGTAYALAGQGREGLVVCLLVAAALAIAAALASLPLPGRLRSAVSP